MAVLRPMNDDDVAPVVALQQPAAVRALADIFPQDTHPFPTEEVTRRWHAEVADPDIDCFVVETDGQVAGFAAVRDAEFLHFGITLDHWGTDLAARAHDEVLALQRARGHEVAWLRVFTGNGRGRAFYAKQGWAATGERSRSPFAPHPELLRYERRL